MASESDDESYTQPKQYSASGNSKARVTNPRRPLRGAYSASNSFYVKGSGARPKTNPQNRPTVHTKRQSYDNRQSNNRGYPDSYGRFLNQTYPTNFKDSAIRGDKNHFDRRSTYANRHQSDHRGAPKTDHGNTRDTVPHRRWVQSSGAPTMQRRNFQQRKPDVRIRDEAQRRHDQDDQEEHQLSSTPSVHDEDDAIKSSTRQRATHQVPSRLSSKPKTPPLSEEELQSFLGESPSDVLAKLVEKSDEFLALLSQDQLTDNTLILILRVLSILCDLDLVSMYIQQLNNVLSVIEISLFLSKHLTRYLVTLPVRQLQKLDGPDDANDDVDISELHSGVILKLLQLFLQNKPNSYSEIGGALILLERVVMKEDVVEELQQLKIDYNTVEQTQRTAKLRAMEKPPPNNFRDIPIFPESKEICQVTKPFLRKNITQGRYENVEHYLDVQFRLLREDFIAPLREGVTEFLSDTDRPQDIRIYKNVFIVKHKMGDNDFIYTLRFDMKPFRRVRWETSKRLLYGSFVCLTMDKFKHITCATVENRYIKELEEGQIDVRFLAETPHTEGPFIMAESAAYFEACRHVLQGLKQIDDNSFPFKKYIVDVKNRIDLPAYLQNDDGDEVTYDFSPLMTDEDDDVHDDDYDDTMMGNISPSVGESDATKTGKYVPILALESWPSKDELHLDESQKAALQTALTKEFTVIQGPPGTGKTYIGLKIIELLLHNKSCYIDKTEDENAEAPILVVCYTNHALDQFLEGIIDFGERNMVRVGSRSNSEQLKYMNLSRMRGRRQYEFGKARRLLRETDVAIRKTLLKLAMPRKVLLSIGALRKYMSLGEHRALSLQVPEGEEPRINQSQKLLDWLRVFNVVGGDWQPSHQQEEKTTLRQHLENINVEDEGYKIQLERQIDERHDDESASEKHQRMEDELACEYAAYDPRSVKCCGKYGNVHPVDMLYQNDVMTDQEAAGVQRVWHLMMLDRWRMYRLWVQRYIERQKTKLSEQRQRYAELSEEVQDNNIQEDVQILRQANVIGMTTTGAAKHRQVLQRVAPRIVIVEEAAEVLEAHIITTLSAKCQHLILIGDHQQLKPNPTVYRLAKWFNLDTSLFERMIRNGVPCQQLTQQHRMRPEISLLMKKHFYKKLEDDESVLNMDDVRGVAHNIFFIDHQHHENEDDDDRTRSNEYEAKVLVELCRYLLHHDYKPSQITVLTTYTGQLFCFRRLMDKETFQGVRVCVVDNFQGEENDIILLSLVRSNEEGSIGFLRTSNRVCVAMSRAKMGFYCIGNATILKKAEIWQNILSTLDTENRLGQALPLVCRNHSNKISKVATPEDFKEMVPLGGCNVACEYRLRCGHVCTLLCHPFDPDHEEFECKKPCLELCHRNEHKCPLECWEECKPCEVKVTKSLSDCDHEFQVKCHDFEKEIICDVQVERTLSKCGHKVFMDCGKNPAEHKCKTLITMTITRCDHQVETFCCEDPDTFECPNKCEKTLRCGHQCPNYCGQPCERSDLRGMRSYSFLRRPDLKACEVLVSKTLPRCGHSVTVPCSKSIHIIDCLEKCETVLKCGHRCTNKCGESCLREKHPEVHLVLYTESFSEKYCRESCETILDCGHRCPNKCGDPCVGTFDNSKTKFRQISNRCRERVEKQLPNCGHTVNVACSSDVTSFICRNKCEKVLPCGHSCPNKCSEPCAGTINSRRTEFRQISDRCKEQVQKQLPNCSHTVNVPCSRDVGSFICVKKCNKVLPCGHPCPNKCCDPCAGDESIKKLKRTNRGKKKQQYQDPSPYEHCEVIVKMDFTCDSHLPKPLPRRASLRP